MTAKEEMMFEMGYKEALRKVEQNVIGDDEPVPAMDRSVAYNWKRIEAEERNKFRKELRTKLTALRRKGNYDSTK
jgi:hypothetical protein